MQWLHSKFGKKISIRKSFSIHKLKSGRTILSDLVCGAQLCFDPRASPTLWHTIMALYWFCMYVHVCAMMNMNAHVHAILTCAMMNMYMHGAMWCWCGCFCAHSHVMLLTVWYFRRNGNTTRLCAVSSPCWRESWRSLTTRPERNWEPQNKCLSSRNRVATHVSEMSQWNVPISTEA